MQKKIERNLKWKKYYTLSFEIPKIEPELSNQSTILFQLARYYFEIHQFDKALENFEALRKLVPSINVNKQLGAIYIWRGQYAKASSTLSEYLLQYPDDAEAYNLLLECYFRSERFDVGIDLSLELMKEFPKENCFILNHYLFSLPVLGIDIIIARIERPSGEE